MVMGFLPKSKIKDRQSEDKILGEDFNENLVKQASYDLRLGNEVYLVGRRVPDKLTVSSPYVSISPGQFAILTSLETIKMPNDLIAFIAIRTQYKMQGLVNISGFHVDPTFKGKLLFAVQNVGPVDVRLKFREPTFSIFFSCLEKGDIEDSRDNEKAHFTQNLAGIRLQDVQLLGGNSITLSKMQKELDRLRTLIMIYGPFAVASFLAMIAILVKLLK